MRQLTPVRAPRGKKTHLTAADEPGETLCSKSCAGWHVAPLARDEASPADVDCPRCRSAGT